MKAVKIESKESEVVGIMVLGVDCNKCYKPSSVCMSLRIISEFDPYTIDCKHCESKLEITGIIY